MGGLGLRVLDYVTHLIFGVKGLKPFYKEFLGLKGMMKFDAGQF
jgi:hypothetical protein